MLFLRPYMVALGLHASVHVALPTDLLFLFFGQISLMNRRCSVPNPNLGTGFEAFSSADLICPFTPAVCLWKLTRMISAVQNLCNKADQSQCTKMGLRAESL